eukprot:gene909-212_t
MSYEQRLEKLNTPTLAFRRSRGDMIEVFKILSKECGYDNEDSDGLLELNVNDSTRGHPLKPCHRRARLNLRKYNFTHRVVSTWNSLPDKVVMWKNVDTFKYRLDRQWKDQPLRSDYKEELLIISRKTRNEADVDVNSADYQEE